MFDLNPQFSNNSSNKPINKFAGRSNSSYPNHHGNYRHRFNGNGGGGGVGSGAGAGGGIQFRLETMDEDSGVCSPPLWRNLSPPDSPVRFTNQQPLSPSSRAQAIARGKREIMEMVENMPETSYELSLKDLVEQRRELVSDVSVDETRSMEEGEERAILGSGGSQRRTKTRKGSVKRQESNKSGRVIVKNGSINHNKGLMINMFFPFTIGSKKRNSIRTSSSFGNTSNHGAGVRFSPKPELLDKSATAGGGDGRDRWWRKFTGSSDNESSGVTSSSSGESTGRSGSSGSSGSSAADSLHSNSARKNNGCGNGCWSFFPSRKRRP